jgi:hypothetical protein
MIFVAPKCSKQLYICLVICLSSIKSPKIALIFNGLGVLLKWLQENLFYFLSGTRWRHRKDLCDLSSLPLPSKSLSCRELTPPLIYLNIHLLSPQPLLIPVLQCLRFSFLHKYWWRWDNHATPSPLSGCTPMLPSTLYRVFRLLIFRCLTLLRASVHINSLISNLYQQFLSFYHLSVRVCLFLL